MSETLPKVAERLFALLCGEAGVTCNRSSDEDIAGWDYVIHFPNDPGDNRPRDEQPGAKTAFVQVKSTDGPPLSIKLKLSNALRMAKERHAYFLVLVVGKKDDRRIFVRHFWKNEIENTLRRVRESEIKGHREHLNRRTIALQLSSDDEHTNDLLYWMNSTICAVNGDYLTTKSEIIDSVGFDKNCTRVSVTLNGSSDEIVDWELGLRAMPKVSSFSLTRVA